MKKAECVSCEEKVKQYDEGVLHSSEGKLFCTTCNIAIDHS